MKDDLVNFMINVEPVVMIRTMVTIVADSMHVSLQDLMNPTTNAVTNVATELTVRPTFSDIPS